MFCKYCGKEMDEDSLFCPKCGKQVASGKATDTETENSTAQKSVPTTAQKAEKETSKEEVQEGNKVTEESITKAKKGKTKTGIKIILAVLVLVAIVVGHFCYNIHYAEIKYSASIEAQKRFNDTVDKYNANNNTANAEDSSRAGLDMIEAYLEYYKGVVKVKGFSDYSEMNSHIDDTIALVERNHSIHGPYREEVITTHSKGFFYGDSTKTTTYTYGETDKFRNYFDKRIDSLKAEWKRVRR